MDNNYLPSLAEISRNGWSDIEKNYNDFWSSKDRLKFKISSRQNTFEVIKYSRINNNNTPVIINHGGPLGRPNELWRILYPPQKFNILFPYQYSADFNGCINHRINTMDIIHNINIVHKVCSDKKCIVSGTSWGATVSLVYATMYPERISKVIISSPIIPSTKSIDYMISQDGGFIKNELLWKYFIGEIPLSSFQNGTMFFRNYYQLLKNNINNIYLFKRFASLFYSVFGDFGYNINPDQIPNFELNTNKLLSFAYLAQHNRPFFVDWNKFNKGLEILKNNNIPIYIILPILDNCSHPDDLIHIVKKCGAEMIKVNGGHSSPETKQQLVEVIKNT